MTFVTLTMIVSVPGSATAASERGVADTGSTDLARGESRDLCCRNTAEGRHGLASRSLHVPRSEAAVAFGPTKTGAATGDATGASLAAPVSLSTTQPEGANDAASLDRNRARSEIHQRLGRRLDVHNERRISHHLDKTTRTQVAALRRYITLKHAKAQQHTRWLGRAPIRTHYRWKQSSSRPYLRWLAARWERRAHRLWKIRAVTLRDYTVRPGSDAWRNAVNEVQRVYPGSYGWLMSCSASEGGWGRFVFNSQGSGAAGWMQYMPGTFAGFSWRARVDADRRGFIVPASAASLFSPLGQALAGGWALRNGLTHHWAGSGCR